ncbi:MAG: hypothetical protein IPM69_08050 [Ignavibacteria bacterium]|nr:hypothetical protein [Ignavibacteria bacterium]
MKKAIIIVILLLTIVAIGFTLENNKAKSEAKTNEVSTQMSMEIPVTVGTVI